VGVFGGVLFIGSTTSSVQLSTLKLYNNSAGTAGGAVHVQGAVTNVYLDDVTALSNHAVLEGGEV
jgi:predicted outer membrane repeat protein